MSGLKHCCIYFEWDSLQSRIVRVFKSWEDRKKIEQNDLKSLETFLKKIIMQRQPSAQENTSMYVEEMQVVDNIKSA